MIEYDIRLPDGRSFTCGIKEHREAREEAIEAASWTQLDFFPCRHCPLKSEKVSHCPLALDVHETAHAFKSLPTKTKVDVIVKTKERWYFKNLPIEEAMESFLSLLMTTSGCPKLRGGSWQRSFHIPFLNAMEQGFINLAHCSLQMFERSDQVPKDLVSQILKDQKDRERIKKDFAERLQEGAQQDKTLAAVLEHMLRGFEPEEDLAQLAQGLSDQNRAS